MTVDAQHHNATRSDDALSSPMNWSVKAMLQSLPGAQWVGDEATINGVVRQVVTDSRLAGPGDVFVALVGERFDAHDFVAQVAQQGAMLAIVSRRLEVDMPQVIVPDTRIAYGLIAKAWRMQFDIPVIAVTGSNGKTTTKEMIAAMLRQACGADHMIATQGNLNNEVGVPHTLLRLRAAHRMAVIELGMNHPGEIAWLAQITQPVVALVNNAQREHQEFMASVEAVAIENGSVFSALGQRGVAVFPANDTYTALWRNMAVHSQTLTFGLRDADVSAQGSTVAGGQRIDMQTPSGNLHGVLHALGQHNVLNAAAAAACALAAGCSVADVEHGLGQFEPVSGRMQPVRAQGDTTLINDTYNANPDSVLAAIDVIAHMPAPRILVLGDMGEVGDNGPAFHHEVGLYAKKRDVNCLFTLGTLSEKATEAFGDNAWHYNTLEALVAALVHKLSQGPHTVLVKGSRFMKMERVIQTLTSQQTTPSVGGAHAA